MTLPTLMIWSPFGSLLLPLALFAVLTHCSVPRMPSSMKLAAAIKGGAEDVFTSLSRQELDNGRMLCWRVLATFVLIFFLPDWSASPGKRPLKVMQSTWLQGVVDAHHVTLKLVGFEGRVSRTIRTTIKEVGQFVSNDDLFSSQLYDHGGQRLPITRKIHFAVEMAHFSLAEEIQAAMKTAFGTGDRRQKMLPVALLDDIIRKDYKQTPQSTFVIYLINAGKFDAPYVWKTWNMDQCFTTHYLGGPLERYAWLDLNAGPLSWGPKSIGEGGVGPHSLPFLMDEFQMQDKRQMQNFLASLAGYAARTTQIAALSSMSRVPRRNVTHVYYILISDSARGMHSLEQQVNDSHKHFYNGLWKLPVEMEIQRVKLNECAYCGLLYSSIKHHTVPKTNMKTFNPIESHLYVEGKQMYATLKSILPHIVDGYHALPSRVLPVVLWHIDPNYNQQMKQQEQAQRKRLLKPIPPVTPLLDRRDAIQSYGDMVIGVHSDGGNVNLDLQCVNGMFPRTLALNPSNITLPLISGVLDSLFGIPHRHEALYDADLGRVVDDYLWANVMGLGPISGEKIAISFSEYDQMFRHTVYAEIVHHWRNLKRLCFDIYKLTSQHPLSSVLTAEEFNLLSQRWNIWKWKKLQLESYLSLYDFDSALRYIKSMPVDVRAMEQFLQLAKSRIVSHYECQQSIASASRALSWLSFQGLFVMTSVGGFIVFAIFMFREVFVPQSVKRPRRIPMPKAQDMLIN